MKNRIMTEETPDQRFERLSRDRIVRPLPKRFYKTVSVTDDLCIALDGRIVKTPMKVALKLKTKALAEAVAAEWEAQVTHISPGAMPLTKLANTAIDRATLHRAEIIAEMVAFAGSDLVCYRADAPEELVELQAKLWDPVMAWINTKLSANFAPRIGIMHMAQPVSSLAAYEALANGYDPFALAATHNLATLTGSALLAAMLEQGVITAEQGWTAAHLDEDWQIAHWGEDDEAKARRVGRHKEFHCCVQFLKLANQN
jgi:chaperone required for assembly of F1-ATPase